MENTLEFKRKKSSGNPLVVTLGAGKWSDTPGCEFPGLFLWLSEDRKMTEIEILERKLELKIQRLVLLAEEIKTLQDKINALKKLEMNGKNGLASN